MSEKMTAQARETSGQPAAAGTAASKAKRLGRREVGEALGVSVASVRRLEGKSLHPTKGDDGVVRFDSDEVAAVVAERTSSWPVKLRRSADGELAAEAFTRFSKGLGVREVVIELRQPPEIFQVLHRQWREAGGLWLPSAVVATIRKSIAARYPDPAALRITTPQDLIDLVHHVLSDLDDSRETLWEGADEIADLKREKRVLRQRLDEYRADLAEWRRWAAAREGGATPQTEEGAGAQAPSTDP